MERLKGVEESLRVLKRPLRVALGLAAGLMVAASALLPENTPTATSSELPIIATAHGINAQPRSGLMGKVIEILEGKGFNTVSPQLPLGAEGQNIDAWKNTFFEHTKATKEKGAVFLVGFSGGVQPVLHLVYERDKGYYCGFLGIAGALEGNIKPLYRRFDQPERIMENVSGNGALIHGRDDRVLPLPGAVALSERIKAPLSILNDGGHFIDLSSDQLNSTAWQVAAKVEAQASKC